MQKKILSGIVLGLFAGILDLIPMIVQSLPWDANISALSMWVIAGFFIATTGIEINPILKGILISFLCLVPCAFIIGWDEPLSLLPVFLMTAFLGGLLGFCIPFFNKRMNL
jgi:hypothetical protein